MLKNFAFNLNRNKALNYENVKQDFFQYLISEGKLTEKELSNPDISIFTHAGEFKEFIQNSNDADASLKNFSGTLDELNGLKFDEEKEEFLFKDEENSDNSFLKDILNDFIKNDEIKKSIDNNGDDKLSQEEVTEFLNLMKAYDENPENITFDDLFSSYDSIPQENLFSENPIQDAAPIQTESAVESSSTSPSSTSPSSHSPSTYNPQNYQNNNQNTNESKTIENMTKDELKAEKTKAQSELTTNTNKLKSVIDGSDSTLKSMKENVDKLFDDYQSQLELINKDLATELESAVNNITDQEKLISDNEKNITDKKNDVSNAQNDYNNSVSTRECLENTLSELKSTDTSNMSDEQKAKLASNITEIENKITEAKAAEESSLDKLNTEKENLSKLEENNNNLKTTLSDLQKVKDNIDSKILKECPQIQTYQDNYNKAKKDYDDYKNKAVQEAKKAVDTSTVNIDKIEKALTKAENTELSNNYKISGLASKYNLNGVNYDIVKMNGFDNLEDFQKFILSKGMTNKGLGGNDWPMQCHNFSNEYGDIMLGTSKINLNSSTAAAEAAKGKDRQFQNVFCDSYDTAYTVIAAELDAGRPVVAKIRTPGKDMTHYGLICGIREGADRNNLQQSDFLYIDSYGGNIGYLGKTRELTGYKGSVHVWQSKDYNFEYKYQNTYAKKYTSAADVRAAYGIA